jgi:protocatechuate 4,5-dioxygenase beta chain
MAEIIGGYFTSHVPAIGGAIHRGDQADPYWQPFFDGLPPVRDLLADRKPDVAVVFSNDHGLNFFLDTMPTFAVGAAPVYNNADEGWGLPLYKPFAGHQPLSWHIIEALVEEEFDITMCQQMLVDHALSIPFELAWPGVDKWPIRIVPIGINTVQHPCLPRDALWLWAGR